MTIRELFQEISEELISIYRDVVGGLSQVWNGILDTNVSDIPRFLWEFFIIIANFLGILLLLLIPMVVASFARHTFNTFLPAGSVMPLLRKSILGRCYNKTLTQNRFYSSWLSTLYLTILGTAYFLLHSLIMIAIVVSFLIPLAFELWIMEKLGV